jgi:hypothetical protein
MSMDSYADVLSPADVETVRHAIRASAEGGFFPDGEFETLFGVTRDIVRKVYQAWPQRSVSPEEFSCAVLGSLNQLIGYPHGRDAELLEYVPEAPASLQRALERLSSFNRQ